MIHERIRAALGYHAELRFDVGFVDGVSCTMWWGLCSWASVGPK